MATDKWGNPYQGKRFGSRADWIRFYGEHKLPKLLPTLPELRGKHLLCWCAPEACHGDLLLELANAPAPAPGRRSDGPEDMRQESETRTCEAARRTRGRLMSLSRVRRAVLAGITALPRTLHKRDDLARIPPGAAVLGVEFSGRRHVVKNPITRKLQIHRASPLNGQATRDQLADAATTDAEFLR